MNKLTVVCAGLVCLCACRATIDGGIVAGGQAGASSSSTSSSSGGAGTSVAPGGSGGSFDAGAAGSVGQGGPIAFEALTPDTYVPKVKTLLTGLPATVAEIAAVEADATALKGLIATWQTTPQYEARMTDFFTMAFQQGDVTAEMIGNVTSFEQGALDPRVIQAMRESFGRTAVALVEENAPFTSVLTTTRFMLTPALMVAMAWLDERQSGDGGGVDDALDHQLGDGQHYTMQADTAIPMEQSADPTSPNFLTFYSPQVAAAATGCRKPVVVDKTNRLTLYTSTLGETMMMFFMGNRLTAGPCVYEAGKGVLAPEDFTTWRMVDIRKPKAGELTTRVYDLPAFRASPELVLSKPHVGFYTTPAFLYTWQTNTSNQARVTANQTMIAGVGRAFDGTLTANPVSTKAIATEHALPGSDCYNCHVTMDPMRQYFRSTFSYFWDLQTDPKESANPGVYAFDGQSHVGTGIAELGQSLAASPRFAIGWTHKLCTWATSAVCDPSGDNKAEPTDPEFNRVVAAFVASHYSWNTLVSELLSSPLVTYAAPTATSLARGATFSVAKKTHLCELLDSRLGQDDSCGLHALPSTATGDPIKTIATVLPSDSYSRGQTVPTLANDPGLFFYSGVENICATLATRVVDATGASTYTSADSATAIASMVHGLMGVTAPRDAAMIAVLDDHFTNARAAGATATDALRSTFILACMAPSTIGVGQ